MAHPFGDDIQLRGRILSYLGDQALPRILRLTMPLFVPDEQGEPALVASGLVLEIGSERLLLTASHTVRDWPGLSISAGNELTLIRGEHWTVHSEGVEFGTLNDKLDVSIVRLERAVADRLDAAEVATLDDVDLTVPIIGRDPFLMVGYPEKRNRDGLTGDEFSALSYSLLMHDGEAELYGDVGAHSTNQLVLPFQKNDVWTPDKRVTAPDLRGVSGGGLWRVPINDRPVRQTLLSAIGVEQHPKGKHPRVLATRMRVILSVVYHSFPTLKAPLERAVERAVA
jgi:hypothetical protein